jgi:hypothetical protein
MSVAAAMQRHSDAGYANGDYGRRTLVQPMLSTAVRTVAKGKAEDAPNDRGKRQYGNSRRARWHSTARVTPPATLRARRCVKTSFSDPHAVNLARLEYCHYPTHAFLTSISRLLASALSPDSTHYPQYRSIQFGRKDFGGVVQRSCPGR